MVLSLNRRRWARRSCGLAFVGASFALAFGAASAQAVTLHCGQTITKSTTLSHDLTGCGPADGIDIGANGITLNLAGHLVAGSDYGGTYGINFQGHSNVLVRNGTIKNFVKNVYIDGSNNRVDSVQESNANWGFYIDGSGGNANGNTLSADRSTGDYFGIYGLETSGNTVTGALVTRTYNAGIHFDSCNYVLGGCSPSGSNTITRSTVTNTLDVSDGIELAFQSNDTLTFNTTTNNPYSGIVVDASSSGTTISNNTSDYNREGINDSGHSTLTSNTADFNVDVGIISYGTDGGGNEAHGNGNPMQCIGTITCS